MVLTSYACRAEALCCNSCTRFTSRQTGSVTANLVPKQRRRIMLNVSGGSKQSTPFLVNRRTQQRTHRDHLKVTIPFRHGPSSEVVSCRFSGNILSLVNMQLATSDSCCAGDAESIGRRQADFSSEPRPWSTSALALEMCGNDSQ